MFLTFTIFFNSSSKSLLVHVSFQIIYLNLLVFLDLYHYFWLISNTKDKVSINIGTYVVKKNISKYFFYEKVT